MYREIASAFGNQACNLLGDDIAWMQSTIYSISAIVVFLLLILLIIGAVVLFKILMNKGGQQNFTAVLKELREFNKSIADTHTNIHLLLREITTSLKAIKHDLRTHEGKDDTAMDSIRNSLSELKNRGI